MVVYICAAVCVSCPVCHHGRLRQVSMVKPRGDNERRTEEGSDEIIRILFQIKVFLEKGKKDLVHALEE